MITFYSGKDIPVFLLDIYAKNEKIDLSKAEKNTLLILTKNSKHYWSTVVDLCS